MKQSERGNVVYMHYQWTNQSFDALCSELIKHREARNYVATQTRYPNLECSLSFEDGVHVEIIGRNAEYVKRGLQDYIKSVNALPNRIKIGSDYSIAVDVLSEHHHSLKRNLFGIQGRDVVSSDII